ncbi:MAG: hypothetical protein JWN07_1330 [Hyphomicrobiales bacterium]|nr:hypothetical protein [Hyphomicrobiales bacterium]
MRFVVPLALIVAGFVALTSFALARSSRSGASCNAVPIVEPAAVDCTASERLCENWLKGRAAYRATFPNSGQTCG